MIRLHGLGGALARDLRITCTPGSERIGYIAPSGCFRLTTWDAHNEQWL